LSAEGLEQAEALIAELARQRPVRILSSPYLRAVQTVLPTATVCGLQVEPRDDLREWASGIDPTPDWERHYRYCWQWPAWSPPGGETQVALTERAVAAVRRLATETSSYGVAVVASHGTWIARALHGLGLSVDVDFWLDMPMPAVYDVALENGQIVAVAGPGIYPH